MSLNHFHRTKMSVLQRLLIVLIIGVLWLIAASHAGGQAEPPGNAGEALPSATLPPTPQSLATFQLALAPNLPAAARARLLAQLRAEYPGNVTPIGRASVRVVAPSDALTDLRSLPGVMFVDEVAVALTLAPARIMANGAITGAITEDGSGVPLEGIQVCAYQSSPYVYECENSDATGVYSISLPAGVYRLNFTTTDMHISEYYDDVPYHQPENYTPVTVHDDTVTPNINAGLALGVYVNGQVTADATGDPIQNAQVEVTGQYYYVLYGYTDANGIYTTTRGLPPGEYRLTFYANGYTTEYYDNAYWPAEAIPLVVTTTHRLGINAALTGEIAITGTVTGDGPLQNIYVTANYGNEQQYANGTSTDSLGRYRIGSLGPIAYKLQFVDSNSQYLTEWHQDKPDWNTADLITLTTGVTTTIDAQLAKGNTITGVVTAAGGGDPLEDIGVTVYDAVTGDYIKYGYTDAAGAYRISGLADGSYKLFFQDTLERYMSEYYDDKGDFATADPIALTGSMTTTADAQLTKGNTITGVVTAAGGGDPLEDIGVTVYDAVTGDYIKYGYTDAAGAYRLGGLADGNYKLYFQDNLGRYMSEYYDDKGDLATADPIALTGGVTTTIDAQLTRGNTIIGVVTAAAGGDPLEDIGVTVYDAVTGSSIKSAYTDAAGAYRLGGLADGNYKLYFQDNLGRYMSEYYDDKGDLATADPIALTGGVTTTIDAQLTRGNTIIGVVTAAAGGDPLEDIGVTVYDAVTGSSIKYGYTDAAGAYRIGGLADGSYKLLFQDTLERYINEYYDDKGDLATADPIALTGGVTTTADAQLTRGNTITGVVTAAAGGDPLEDIGVTVYDAVTGDYIKYGYTDAAGAYRIGGLADGSYKLFFQDTLERYMSEYYDDKGDFATADPIALTGGVTTTADAQLARGNTITGVVTAAGGGDPLENIRVRIYNVATGSSIKSAYTDAAGAYRLGGLADGNYKLYFQDNLEHYQSEYYDDKGDLATADLIALTGGVTTTADAQLARGNTITGVVTAAGGGDPLENIRVRIYNAATGSSIKSAYTDAAGAYRIGGLADGNYKLYFQDNLGRYLSEYYDNKQNLNTADIIALAAEMTQTVNVDLARGGCITGRVVDAVSGMGVANVSVNVSCKNEDYPSGSASSDAQGYYTTTGLYTGVYQVNFSPPRPYYTLYYENSLTSNLFTPVVVTSGITTTGIDVKLQQGYLITGVVSGASSVDDIAVGAWYGPNSYYAFQSYTRNDGTYEIGPLMIPGPYRVYFQPYTLYRNEWYNDAAQYRDAQIINVTHTVTGVNAHLEAGGRITGSVTNGDGAPLNGAGVYIYPAESSSALINTNTDEKGHYVTEARLPEGEYYVEFNAPPGYTGQWYANAAARNGATPVTIAAGGVVTDVNAVLARYENGAITGTVTAADTGLPLTVWVYAYNESGNSVRSIRANGGVYVMDKLPVGVYRLNFSSVPAPYVGTYYHSQPDLAHAERITVTANVTVANINQALQRGSAITGTVTGAGGIPGVSVYAYRVTGGNYTSKSATTGPDGAYRLDGMYPGGYKVQFTPPSPFPRLWYAGADNADAAEVVTVTTNTVVPNINVTMSPGGVITGIITAADTGAAMPNTYVNVYNQNGNQVLDSIYADADGRYQTLGLPAGSYYLFFDRQNWLYYRAEWYTQATNMSAAISVTVPASGVVPNINAALQRGGSISGWIYDAQNGIPLPGAYTYFYNIQNGSYAASQYANQWGYYQVAGLADGDYKAYANKTGYVTRWYSQTSDYNTALTITVTGINDTPDINFYLEPFKKVYLPLVLRSES